MGSPSPFEDSDYEDSDDGTLKVTRTANSYKAMDSVFNKLNSLRQNGTFTDFTIKVQGAIIQCNKNILSAECAYFETMFQSGMKEATEGELTLNDMNSKVVGDIINYLYHQEIDIELELIMEYLDVAEMFLMQDLKLKIDEFMYERTKRDNCVEWYHIAKTYNLRKTLHTIKCLIMEYFDIVALNPEFHTFTIDDMTDIISYRCDNTKDITKLKVCVTWILEDKPNREKQLKHLIEYVNMRKCPLEHLTRLEETFKEVLDSNKELQDKINVGKCIAAMQSTNVMMIANERKNDTKIYKLDLYHNHLKEVDIWGGKTLNGQYCCVTPKGMFSIGYPVRSIWSHPYPHHRDCTFLDPWQGAVFPIPQFPKFRESVEVFCVTYVEDGTFVFCEGEEDEVVAFVLESGRDQTWERNVDCRLSLHEERSPVMWSIKKLLFVLTTKDDTGMRLRCFDSTTKQWSSRTPPPIESMRGAKIVVAQDKAYIVGGEDSLCLRYDHSEAQWEELAKPPQENEHGSAFYANGRIYLCGVLRNETNEDMDDLEDTEEYASEHVIEEYDIAANCWKRSALPAPPLKVQFCVPYKE